MCGGSAPARVLCSRKEEVGGFLPSGGVSIPAHVVKCAKCTHCGGCSKVRGHLPNASSRRAAGRLVRLPDKHLGQPTHGPYRACDSAGTWLRLLARWLESESAGVHSTPHLRPVASQLSTDQLDPSPHHPRQHHLGCTAGQYVRQSPTLSCCCNLLRAASRCGGCQKAYLAGSAAGGDHGWHGQASRVAALAGRVGGVCTSYCRPRAPSCCPLPHGWVLGLGQWQLI